MAKSVLEQLVSGVEKLPGNALGGPVDLANSVLNIVRAGIGVAGRETGLISKAENLPELDENPLGGSKWINSKFGLGESTGPVDTATQFVGGLVSPVKNTMTAIKAGALLKPLGAVILPAALVKGEEVTSTAQRFLSRGASPEKVFNATGVFPGLESSAPLKAVLPDTNAKLQSFGGVIRNFQGDVTISPLASKLSDVLDHPELFKAVPGLADTPIMGLGHPGGVFNSIRGDIKIGPSSSEEGMMSVILHETQHAIQKKFGFEGGGSPRDFISNPTALSDATRGARQDLSPAGATNLKKLDQVQEDARNAYLNIGGELEAQIVQAQRKSGNYTGNPRELAIQQAGGIENINPSGEAKKVDTDPILQSIIKQYTGM